MSIVTELAVMVVVAAVMAPSPAAAGPRETEPVGVEGCLLQIVEVHDDADRLGAFVPHPFRVARFYGPSTGAASVWTFGCASVVVPGGGSGPGRFSFVVVQIDRPDGPAPAVSYLHNFDYFVVAGRTDRLDLVRHAHGSVGLEYVRQITFERSADILPRSSTTVPGRSGGVEAEAAPYLQHPLHDHDNSFWGLSHVGRAAELQLRLANAIDKWCPYGAPGCSEVRTEPASMVSALFGCEIRTDGLGIDHDPVPTGSLTFV